MNKAEALIFVPGAEEYEAIMAIEAEFDNFSARPILTGPGAIMSAAAMGAEAARTAYPPAFWIGAGLCGSLNINLKAGEALLSDSAILGDWLMEDGKRRTHGIYGGSSYKAMDAPLAESLAIKGQSPFAETLWPVLAAKGFRRGRLLTTETYVTDPAGKLERGRLWGCLAADHESGALARAAMVSFSDVPWLNLRIVADTIGEQMGADGRAVNLSETLALKLLVLLSALDAHFPKCASCQGCAGG